MLHFPYSARGACCTAKNTAKWNAERQEVHLENNVGPAVREDTLALVACGE